MNKAEEKVRNEYVINLEKPTAGEAAGAARESEQRAINKHKKWFATLMGVIIIAASVIQMKWLSISATLVLLIALYMLDNTSEIMIAMYAAAPVPLPIRLAGATLAVARQYMGPFAFLADWIIAPMAISYAVSSCTKICHITNTMTWRQIHEQRKDLIETSIDEYWTGLGLTEREGTCVGVRAVYTKPGPGISLGHDLSAHAPIPEYMVNDRMKWTFADTTDAMHVKSLQKRLMTDKSEAKPEMKDLFTSKMINQAFELPLKKPSKPELIVKALSSDGSAGEFAKHTTLEPIWKDHTNEVTIQLWTELVDSVLRIVRMGIELAEEFTEYMLYRKVEIMALDEDGNIKITRIMQAPNLYLRVVDSVVFGAYNEAVVKSRDKGRQQVGIKILTELKMILPYYEGYTIVCTDFPDFDGHQAPYQMASNLASRITYELRNGTKFDYIAYLIYRYKVHVMRTVRSTNGIHMEVTGQQASGDITTSDDNTMRTAAYCSIVEDRIKGRAILSSVAQGDDVSFVSKTVMENQGEMIVEIAESVAHELGWETKPAEIHASGPTTDGNFLSHMVNMVEIETSNGRMEVPLSIRKGHRVHAKFVLAAEQSETMTSLTRANIVAKMMSYGCSLPSRPDIVIMAAAVAVLMNANPGKTTASYSWRTVKAIPSKAFDMSESISNQLGIKLSVIKVKMMLTTQEIEQLIDALTRVQEIVDAIATTGIRIQEAVIGDYIVVSIVNKWIIETSDAMSKRKQISNPDGDLPWWRRDKELYFTAEPIVGVKQKMHEPDIRACKHTTNVLVEKIEVYDTKVVGYIDCGKCYASRVKVPRTNEFYMRKQ